MLAQFAILAFALLAVAALAVDVGLVTLARVQMQNAADGAALEGIRWRDVVPGDAYASDCLRRIAARDAARGTFEGASGLQFNQAANEAHGDMVSGMFRGYDPRPLPDEDFDYTQHPSETREDFDPGPRTMAGDSPFADCPPDYPGGMESGAWDRPGGPPGDVIAGDAVLVRLRRTRNADGLDEIGDPLVPGGPNGVSSNGGALPLFFGRGALISSPDPSGGYSVRRDGLTVRAAAVARTRPALRVGRPLVSAPAAPGTPATVAIPGLAPIAITDATLLALDTPVTATIGGDGTIATLDTPPAVVGRLVADADLASVATVGGPLPAASPRACDALDPFAVPNGPIWFAPVFHAVGPALVVAGFVPLDVFRDCSLPATLALTRRRQRVAARNASATLYDGFPAAPDDVGALLAAVAALADAGITLLAPAVAR